MIGLLLATAWAELPLPTYAEVLTETAYYEVLSLVETGWDEPTQSVVHTAPLEQAIESATRFEERVMPDSGMEYLIGLSHRYLGDEDAALVHLRRATELDADNAAAWADLAELLLWRSEWDEARAAYQRTADLHPRGPGAFVAPLRLAFIAGVQQDPDAFERALREALRRGFTFRLVVRDPNWQQLFHDPVVGSRMEQLLTVYSDPETLEAFQQPLPR